MKQLIIFSGLPGSGKSTLSSMYSENHGAVWLSVDPVEGVLKLNGINNEKLGVLSYNIVKTIADDNLLQNKIVVIDAVNATEEARDVWRSLAKKHNIVPVIVECVVEDTSVHKKRIESRIRNIAGYSEITWARVIDRKKEYTQWHEERLIVTTDTTIIDSYTEVEKYIISRI